MADATVTLGVQTAQVRHVFVAQTSASGRFVFMGVAAPSAFTLTSQKPGWLQGSYGQTRAEGSGRTLSLVEGEWKADLDVPLWPAGAIEGRVETDQGEPAVQASVVAFRQVTVYGSRRYVQGPVVQTDDRGVYRIEPLVPGPYVLAVLSAQLSTPPEVAGHRLNNLASFPVRGVQALLLGSVFPMNSSDGRVLVYPTTYFPSSPTLRDAELITVSGGVSQRDYDFRLSPVRAFVLAGRLQAPATSSGLTLRLVRSSDRSAGGEWPVAISRASDDGRFAFVGVPPGDYILEAVPQVALLRSYGASYVQPPDAMMPMEQFGISERTLPGIEPPLSLSTIRGDQPRQGFWARERVSVVDRDVTGVAVLLRRTVTLKGVLQFDDRPTGATEQPKSVASTIGMSVDLEPADARVEVSGAPTANVGRQGGQFMMTGVLPGEYVFRVRDRMLRAVEWQGQDVVDVPFPIGETDIDGVKLRITSQSSAIEGSVGQDPTRGAVDAAVLCFPVSQDQWAGYGLSPRRIKATRVSTSGHFRLSELPGGEYFVVRVPPDDMNRWQDPEYLRTAAKRATRVTLGWGELATVDLQRAGQR